MITFSIPCLFGLEGLVGDEVKRLGLNNVKVEDRRVLASGELLDLARLNVNLRCGERVQIVLGRFMAREFDHLFEGVRAICWENYIPKDGCFQVKGYSRSSKLQSVPACQSIVEKAVAKRLSAAYGLEHFPKTGARYQIQFALVEDEALIMLDTSGDGLHKRGYRAVGVEAPLRETLAAGMVQLSRFRGKDPFCDPFCGSGTIPIEAALIAKNRAPGLDRSFDAQKWGFVDKKLWMTAAEEAMDKEFHGKYDIWGGDIDPKAIAIATANAEKAGVEDIVRFAVSDMTTLCRKSEYGQLVTNPPYGERLMDNDSVKPLYKAFGEMYRKLPPKWRVLVLSSAENFEKSFGRKADKKRKLYNGRLKCDLYFFQRG